MDFERELEKIVNESVKRDIENTPRFGQVWVLRDDEVATLAQMAYKGRDFPKKVWIKKSEINWGGKKVLAVDVVTGQPWQFTSLFEVLYEIHRPSIWERLEREDNHPENHEKRSESLVDREVFLTRED